MGLDQYAHTRLPKSLQAKNEKPTELAYWRKHNALQGWMESLWRDNGGEGEFNCVDVYLTLDDINDLEAAVTRDNLPETGGFFYGSDSRFDEYQKEATLKFIKDAKAAIEQGLIVVYSSWW
jgi:hypothetical protein